jgi:hypothetical protein
LPKGKRSEKPSHDDAIMKATDAEINALLARVPQAKVLSLAPERKLEAKPNKFGAIKTDYKGIIYDSKGEALHAAYLDFRQAAGEILWWHPKPGSFHLGCPQNIFRPDFLVCGHDRTWIEEFKGRETAKWRRDVRLWEAYGPCLMRVFRGKTIVEVWPIQLV